LAVISLLGPRAMLAAQIFTLGLFLKRINIFG